MPTTSEMWEKAMHFSDLIDAGCAAMRDYAQQYAAAQEAYSRGKSEAWARCPNDDPSIKAGERDWTADRRKSWVDAQVAPQRRARDLASDMRQSALESVRSRRGQLSAIQTFANAEREEAAFARTGPG